MKDAYSRKREQQADLTWAAAKLAHAQGADYYGEITFVFQHGVLKRADYRKTELPPSAKPSGSR